MKENETRRLLEEAFDRLEPASAEKEQSPETQNLEELLEDKFLKAPSSYKKEYWEIFESLPPDMRKYLHERESEVEKNFSRLNNDLQIKKFLDEVFSATGSKHGFKNSRDWIEKLVMVENLLEESPKDTLLFLARAYGVDFADNKITKPSVDLNELRISILTERLEKLRAEFDDRERRYAELLANAKNAQKSKEASFAPKGAFASLGTDFDNMTTRQILEKKFSELEG